jgi:hypothetical protein
VIGRYAVVVDEIYPDEAKHIAECKTCSWKHEGPKRPAVMEEAARHIEATDHHIVCVHAVEIDWLMGMPSIPRYEARRVLG